MVLVRMLVRVLVPGLEPMRRNGHHQAAVLDAFEADEKIGEVLDARSLAVDDQHFKAGVVIKMRMARGNHQVVVLVLRLREFLGDSVGVVVKDQSDGADDGRVGCGGPLAHQPVADEVAKGFGTVRVSAFLNGAVEPLQEIGIEGNADSAQVPHTHSRVKSNPG
jgi:hypothetical protein